MIKIIIIKVIIILFMIGNTFRRLIITLIKVRKAFFRIRIMFRKVYETIIMIYESLL
jgi:hypothetical protein